MSLTYSMICYFYGDLRYREIRRLWVAFTAGTSFLVTLEAILARFPTTFARAVPRNWFLCARTHVTSLRILLETVRAVHCTLDRAALLALAHIAAIFVLNEAMLTGHSTSYVWT